MVASQGLRLRQHDPGGWLLWDYSGRLAGLAVLAALAWPVALPCGRGEAAVDGAFLGPDGLSGTGDLTSTFARSTPARAGIKEDTEDLESLEVAHATGPRGRDAFVAGRTEGPCCSRAPTRKVMTFGNRLGREPPSSSRLSPLCDLSRPPENSHHLAQYATKTGPMRGEAEGAARRVKDAACL